MLAQFLAFEVRAHIDGFGALVQIEQLQHAEYLCGINMVDNGSVFERGND